MTIFEESQVVPDMTNIDKDAPANATETKYALSGAVTGWIKVLGGKIA